MNPTLLNMAVVLFPVIALLMVCLRKRYERKSLPLSLVAFGVGLVLLALPLTGRGQSSVTGKPDEKTRILFIVNCSHSMWDHWQSDAKIKVTQKVLLRFLDSIAGQEDMEVALRVFGHLNRGSYTTHLEVPFSDNNRYALQSKIKTLVPNGGNSTATALSRSLDDFPLTDKSRNIIIIITDGIDDADGDICQVARQVQLSGIVVQTFILGIGNPNDFRQSLDCAGTFTYMPEEDGYTVYRTAPKKYGLGALEIVQQKRAYKQTVQVSEADGEEVISEENYGVLPIVPLYPNDSKQSALVGLRAKIDAYDMIHSGFANDLQDCA